MKETFMIPVNSVEDICCGSFALLLKEGGGVDD